MRQVIPTRRVSITEKIVDRSGVTLHVTFGVVSDRVVEVFCSPSAQIKEGTDVAALATDGCILLSLLLQFGISAGKIVNSLSELRSEGKQSGPAASWLGLIARAALAIENELERKEQL